MGLPIDVSMIPQMVEQWQQALGKHELVRVCEVAYDLALEVRARMGTDDEDPPARLARQILGYAIKTFRALRLLIAEGFAGEALAQSRTLIEHAINLAYVHKDPVPRSERYLNYAFVRVVELMSSLLGSDEWLRRISEMEPLGVAYERLEPHFGGSRAKTWSGKTTYKMAVECNMTMLYLYYMLASDLSHGNVISWMVNDGNPDAPDSPVLVANASVLAGFAMLAIVFELVEWMGLQTDLTIINHTKELVAILKGTGFPIPFEIEWPDGKGMS